MRNPCGGRLARCLCGCKDMWAFQIVSRLRQWIHLRNKVAIRDRKIREYSSADLQRRRSGMRAISKTRRSLDFHHHQRAIVCDGASLCKFLDFLEQAVGKFTRIQVHIGG